MSGSTIGGVVGGVIGFYFGGPSGAQWGWMIGSAVGGYVDPTVVKGPKLTDPQKQTSSEGVPRAIVYGTAAVMGNVIMCQSVPTEHKHEDNGKGGSTVQETYTYTRTCAIRICEAAPLGGEMRLRRCWVNGKLAYDATGSGTIDADSAKFLQGMTFYSGSETQLPDANLEALPEGDGGGVGNVCAHRGTCYAVLKDVDVTQTGGALPQFRWEVVSHGTEESTCTEPDLLRWWPLDDAAGGGAARELIAGQDGVYSSGVGSGGILGAGSGGSVEFSDFDQYMVVDSSSIPQVHNMDEWTVSCWAQPRLWNNGTSDVNGGGVVDKRIAAYFGSFFSGSKDWALALTGPSTPAEHKNMTPNGAVTNTAGVDQWDLYNGSYISHGQTVYLAMTWKKNPTGSLGRAELYMNGGLVDYLDDVGTGGTTGHYFVVGGGYSNSDSYQFIGCVSDVKIYQRALTGSEIASKYHDANEWLPLPDGGGFYDRNGNIWVSCTTSVSPDNPALSDVVADLCERGGVTDYDVTALASDIVRGYPITQPTDAAGAINVLQQVYFFDMPEWGNSGDTYTKIRAVKRGGASVLNLSDDDLVDVDSDEDTRAQSVEFPRKLNLVFLDPDANYESAKETAERVSENVKAISEATVSTAVVFTRAEAAPRADIMLRVAWEEAAGTSMVTVPEEFTQYTPSDIVTRNGKRYRLDKANATDGQTEWTLTRDRASAYSSNATGSTGVALPPSTSSIRGPTMFQAMNLSSLRSSDNVPGMYLAACGLMPGWAGCDVFLSVDGGLTETNVMTIIDPATMGWLTADLDSSDVLAVNLYSDDELDDATTDQIAAGINACAVLTDGVAEIIQFADATDTGVRTFDLETLTRGRLGTTETDHFIDDPFVLLDSSVPFLELDATLAGKTLIFRAVSRGTVAANNPTYSVVFDPPTFVIDGGEVT